MLNITDINNNADNIRVINHNNKYSKNDLLNAAERVKAAKHCYIDKRGARLILSHGITGNNKIMHKTPEKKAHKLFINEYIDEYGDGYNWNIEENEFFNNVIVYGNREFIDRVKQSDFSELFETIKNNFEECGDDLNNYKSSDKYTREIYKNMCDIIQDHFNVTVSPYISGIIRKILNKSGRYYNDAQRIAELMTVLTPYTWRAATIRGCCQRDYNTIYYPIELYNDDDIRYFEAFYFGMYTSVNAAYKNDAINFDYPYYYDRNDIIQECCNNYGVPIECARVNWYY